MSYVKINQFGNYKPMLEDQPVWYSVTDKKDFLHNQGLNPYSKESQAYMAEKCSIEWDGACELASTNKKKNIVNTLHGKHNFHSVDLTAGEILIKNAAKSKYRVNKESCGVKYVQYDPLVAHSPLVAHRSDVCVPLYKVDPKTIESDPVMNKILEKPEIALDILKHIHDTMKSDGSISQLSGTRLGKFFDLNIATFN
jgi:hypothetical protein